MAITKNDFIREVWEANFEPLPSGDRARLIMAGYRNSGDEASKQLVAAINDLAKSFEFDTLTGSNSFGHMNYDGWCAVNESSSLWGMIHNYYEGEKDDQFLREYP